MTPVYDTENRKIGMADCVRDFLRQLGDVLRACLQPFMVSTKGDVLRKEMKQRLGLTQGSPLSPLLFLDYINDIYENGREGEDMKVEIDRLGRIGLILTADDVTIHSETWEHLEFWLDLCSRWSRKNRMKWEPSKC